MLCIGKYTIIWILIFSALFYAHVYAIFFSVGLCAYSYSIKPPLNYLKQMPHMSAFFSFYIKSNSKSVAVTQNKIHVKI